MRKTKKHYLLVRLGNMSGEYVWGIWGIDPRSLLTSYRRSFTGMTTKVTHYQNFASAISMRRLLLTNSSNGIIFSQSADGAKGGGMKRFGVVVSVAAVIVCFALQDAGALKLKDITGKIPTQPGIPAPPSTGDTANAGGDNSPYLQHRESLVPYTGLGNRQKTKYFKRLNEALSYLKPKHDNCYVKPDKKEMNNSNYKVWPSHNRKIAHCTKLLADKGGKQACYVIELDCKEQLPGQKEPSPGEWGPEYDRCDALYDSGFRWKETCPTSF